ncbi:MAG: alanyl-tRNA synthetase [Bacteroidota bacterium]
MSETVPPPDRKATTWIKRFGVAGFLFFLIKGLLWLSLPALLVWLGC